MKPSLTPAFALVALLTFAGWPPTASAQPADEALPTIQLDGMELPFVRHENFESGRDHWTTTDDAAWTLRAADPRSGQLFGLNRRQSDYQPKHRSPHNIALWKHDKVNDFVLTFDVRSTKDTGNHRDCCVFFGYRDNQHFYYVHLGAKPDPHSGQIMIVNEAPRVAITNNQKKTPWDDDWHTVQLIRDSKQGTIQVFFDEMQTPHMEVVDKTFTEGRIGIGSFDDLNEFDDIVVRTR